MSYPGHVTAVQGNELVMASGKRIVIDDGRDKTHAQKLDDADIEDMLSQIYPIGSCSVDLPPAQNFEPGRIRNEAFFTAVYGRNADVVKKSLSPVPWFGQTLQVTRTLDVDRKLAAVAADLITAPSDVRKMLAPSAGVFNWRVIAGTRRLSVHSFGAAIDVNTAYGDFWAWHGGKPGAPGRYRNRIPRQIVEAFERQGFIWGGQWYHYDTLHFEYRPELIAIGRLAEERGCPRQ